MLAPQFLKPEPRMVSTINNSFLFDCALIIFSCVPFLGENGVEGLENDSPF